MQVGASVFGDNCATCHGAGGAGVKGYPNLRDDVWLWGGSLDAIQHTIQVGIRSGHPRARGPSDAGIRSRPDAEPPRSTAPRSRGPGRPPRQEKEKLAGTIQAVGHRPHRHPPPPVGEHSVFALFTVAYIWFGYWLVVEMHVVGFETLDRLNRALHGLAQRPGEALRHRLRLPAAGHAADLAADRDPRAGPLAGHRLRWRRRCSPPRPWCCSTPCCAARRCRPPCGTPSCSPWAPTRWSCCTARAGRGTSSGSRSSWPLIGALFAWYVTADVRFVMIAGLAYSIATLGRLLQPDLVPAIGALMIGSVLSRLGADGEEIEGTTVGFAAPTAYVIALWTAFNLILLSNPFAWITNSNDAAGGHRALQPAGAWRSTPDAGPVRRTAGHRRPARADLRGLQEQRVRAVARGDARCRDPLPRGLGRARPRRRADADAQRAAHPAVRGGRRDLAGPLPRHAERRGQRDPGGDPGGEHPLDVPRDEVLPLPEPRVRLRRRAEHRREPGGRQGGRRRHHRRGLRAGDGRLHPRQHRRGPLDPHRQRADVRRDAADRRPRALLRPRRPLRRPVAGGREGPGRRRREVPAAVDRHLGRPAQPALHRGRRRHRPDAARACSPPRATGWSGSPPPTSARTPPTPATPTLPTIPPAPRPRRPAAA